MKILFAAIALLALAAPSRAFEPTSVSYQQFTSATFAGGDDAPVWSHDGTAVFYGSRVTGFPYIFRKTIGSPMVDSGTRLTTWLFDEYSAAVSSDDAWVILCVGDSLNSRHLYRCPASGGIPLTQLTVGPYYDLDPDWYGSSSGLVAFGSNRGGAGYQIWTVAPNGTQAATAYTQVTDAGHNDFHPSFSQDGSKIVFSSDRGGGTQLFVTTWNGSSWGAPVQITTGGGAKQNPDWSADGQYLAYEVTGNSGTDLWIAKADGTGAQLVTSAGSYNARPSWSASGNQLAFVSDRAGGKKYIWLADGLYTPAAPESWGKVKARYRR